VRAVVRRPESERVAEQARAPAAGEPEGAIEGPALLLEVGGTASRATLLDRVAGRHRFVASGAAPMMPAQAAGDVILSIRGAVGEVERVTRRRLADSAGLVYPERSDGGGLDAAVVTVGAPLRVTLLTLGNGQASAQVQAALDGLSALVVDVVGVEVVQAGASPLERLVGALGQGPDVVLVLGPSEREADKPTDVAMKCLAKALELTERPRPAVLYVGPPEVGVRLHDLLGQWEDLRTVDSRGSPEARAAIRGELRTIWQERLASEAGGFGPAQSWTGCQMVPTAECFAAALRFLALRRGCQVWGVDVGSSTTCLVRATAETASIHVQEAGVARRIQWALADKVLGQLATGVDPDSVRDYLWNRCVRPWAIPETPEEQMIGRALAREAIRSVRPTARGLNCAWRRQIGLVVARGGGLQSVGHSSDAAWAIADGLGASGVFELALDRHHMLPGLGALASIAPGAAVEALLADGLTPMATMVVGAGHAGPGERVALAELRGLDGLRRQTVVLAGQPASLPLGASEVADLTLTPERGADFGWGRGAAVEMRVRGGRLGLLVGARAGAARMGPRPDGAK